MKRIASSSAVVFLLSAAAAFAQSVEPEFSRDPVGVKQYPGAPRIAAAAAVRPVAVLGAADPADLAEVEAWNAEGRTPMKNGFARVLPDLVRVKLTGAAAAAGATPTQGVVRASERGLVWSGTFHIEAYRVRLRLDNADLPEGAVLWIYSANEAPLAFDRSLLDEEGGLWTPSVGGGVVHLEIEIPTPNGDIGSASFQVNRIMELVATRAPETNDDPSCLISVNCVGTDTLSGINSFRQGVAHLQYVKSGGSYVCSGGLLNDNDPSSFVPYFLSANHCFSSQSSASSLEAFWDWRFASCDSGTIPNPANFPRSNGSTLLATGAASDFTLVQMSSIPSNRFFFGWTTDPNAIPSGTILYRISHPAPEQYGPLPQMFSATLVNTSFGGCSTRPRPAYIYSTGGVGGTYGGSSGSPVFLSDGKVVGQLMGACGPTPSEGCNDANATVDGNFATTFPSISQYVYGSATTPQPCVANSKTLCLGANGRFKVQATYRTSSSSGSADVVKLTNDTGYFWFFNSSNVEAVIKILDACGLNSRFWVFAGGLTDVEVAMTITDTKNGTVKTYTNPMGTKFAPIQDTGAFATCP